MRYRQFIKRMTKLKALRLKQIKNNLKVVIFTLVAVVLLCKTAIFFGEEKSLFRPDKEVIHTPQKIGLDFEDVYFKTKDNESLNGWFITAKDAKATLLYCHGRSGNLSDELRHIQFFHAMGFNLFFFDYRGFGLSSGHPTEQGLYKDAQAAYDFLLTRNDVDKDKIIVYGKTIGGPVALDLALHRKVVALILEGCFVSLKTYVGDLGGPLPTELLVTEKFNSLPRVPKVMVPKLFVQGMDDEFIDFAEGRLLFNKAAAPKEFLAFEGTHNDDLFVTSEEFKSKLSSFLAKNHIL